jgi:MFS family permease
MNRNLILMSLSLFTWGIGEGMFLIFQPIALEQWGASPALIGTILGATGIMMALAQIPAGHLADRLGPRPIMWASWILGALSCWVMALSNSLVMFTIGLLLYVLTSFVVAPMNSYIAAKRGNMSVERALTTVSAMFHLGAVIGPILGGVLGDKFGVHAIYRISASIFVVSTLIILMVEYLPPTPHQEEKKDTSLLRNSRFISLLPVIFLGVLATYLPQPMTPMVLQNQRHLSLTAIGQLGALGSLGNALVVLVLGGLKASAGLIIGLGLVGASSLCLWLGDSFALYGLGYFFLGGYRLYRLMSLAFTRHLVHESRTGLAFGMIETLNAVAVILAPTIAGFLYEYDPYLIFILSLVFILVVMVFSTVQLSIFSRQEKQAALETASEE